MINSVKPNKIISIHGAPRSGTSWLGQIFNSNPNTKYAYQPLFSYKYKNYINENSTKNKIDEFLVSIFNDDTDRFINQIDQLDKGVHQKFIKVQSPEILIMKMVRYHQIIENMLLQIPRLKVVCIIRHPCGSINSWLKTPREFNPEWDRQSEWYLGDCKNKNRSEEYNGYKKWCEAFDIFYNLRKKYPHRVYLLSYENLVEDAMTQTQKIFDFCELKFTEQTRDFLKKSNSREIDHPDTVFRKKSVANRWKKELDTNIKNNILDDLNSSPRAKWMKNL